MTLEKVAASALFEVLSFFRFLLFTSRTACCGMSAVRSPPQDDDAQNGSFVSVEHLKGQQTIWLALSLYFFSATYAKQEIPACLVKAAAAAAAGSGRHQGGLSSVGATANQNH